MTSKRHIESVWDEAAIAADVLLELGIEPAALWPYVLPFTLPGTCVLIKGGCYTAVRTRIKVTLEKGIQSGTCRTVGIGPQIGTGTWIRTGRKGIRREIGVKRGHRRGWGTRTKKREQEVWTRLKNEPFRF